MTAKQHKHTHSRKNPSDELTATIKEREAMINDPNTKKFDSVDTLFAVLDAEE